MFQLTEAKANAQPTPDGYEAPVGHANFLIPWATATGKRKRDGDGDDDIDIEDDEDEEIDEDDDDDA